MSFTVWERNESSLIQPRHEWAWVEVGSAGELYCYAIARELRELAAIYAPGTWTFAQVIEEPETS